MQIKSSHSMKVHKAECSVHFHGLVGKGVV